jgi:hypothetical protein
MDRSSTPEQFAAPGPDRTGQAVDLVAYVLGVLVVFGVGLGAVSAALGMGLIGVKYGLFVLGILTLGYATLKVRPVRPDKDPQDARFPIDRGEETPFQARVQRVVPARYRLDHDERLSDGTKLFVASLAMLLVSYLMESVFGIAVA